LTSSLFILVVGSLMTLNESELARSLFILVLGSLMTLSESELARSLFILVVGSHRERSTRRGLMLLPT
jgi:hypothetical protein